MYTVFTIFTTTSCSTTYFQNLRIFLKFPSFSGQQGCYGRIVSRRGGPHYIFGIDHNYSCFTENPQVEDGQGGQDGGHEAGGGNYSHQVPLILL